jgi:hypothetical protein
MKAGLFSCCRFSKLNPFIGGFAGLAKGCFHGETVNRSARGRPKRTPNPHRAVVRSCRAALSNRGAQAQRYGSAMIPSLRHKRQLPLLPLPPLRGCKLSRLTGSGRTLSHLGTLRYGSGCMKFFIFDRTRSTVIADPRRGLAGG